MTYLRTLLTASVLCVQLLALTTEARADQTASPVDVTENLSKVKAERKEYYLTQAASVNRVRDTLVPALQQASFLMLDHPLAAAFELKTAYEKTLQEVNTDYPYGMPHTIQAILSGQEIVELIFKTVTQQKAGPLDGQVKFTVAAEYLNAVLWASELDAKWYWAIVNVAGESREVDLPNDYFKGFGELANRFLGLHQTLQNKMGSYETEAKGTLAVVRGVRDQMIQQSLLRRKLIPVSNTLGITEQTLLRTLSKSPIDFEEIDAIHYLVEKTRKQITLLNKP